MNKQEQNMLRQSLGPAAFQKYMDDQREKERLLSIATNQDNAAMQLQSDYMRSLLGTPGGTASGTSGGMGGSLNAEQRLASLLDNPESIKETGAYKFRVGQGQEALQRSLGAKGLLGSGNRLTELTKYGQDMASQEYDSQFGRLADLLGRQQQYQLGLLGAARGGFGGSGGGSSGAWDAYKSRGSGAESLYSAPKWSVDPFGRTMKWG